MLHTDMVVEVRDAALNRVGQLAENDLAGMLVVPRLNAVGSWSVALPALRLLEDGTELEHELCALLRTPGYGLIVTTPDGVLSGPTTYVSYDATSDDPGGTYTIEGVSDLKALDNAESWPDPSNADPETAAFSNDVRTGSAEALLHAFVNANIGPAAPLARRNPNLTLAASLGRGPVLTKSPRYKNLLELCQEIASGTSLVFDVVQIGDALQFVVTEAVDRSLLVRLDIQNNLLDSEHVEYSAPEATHVLVLGQGEGTERTAVYRSSPESLAAAAQWGVRIERTIDQRNTNDLAELEQAAADELTARGKTMTSMRVVPAQDQADDIRVGDLITVVVGDTETTALVTERPLSVTTEGVFVGLTVGDPAGYDWESMIDSRQSAVESRVSAIERNAEGGSGGGGGGYPLGATVDWFADVTPSWGLEFGQTIVGGATTYSALAALHPEWVAGANLVIPDPPDRQYLLGQAYLPVGSRILTTSYADVPLLTVTAYSDGSPVEIDWELWLQNAGSGLNRTGAVRVLCDGVEVEDWDYAAVPVASGGDQRYSNSGRWSHTPSAGVHTWKVQARCYTASSIGAAQGSLTVTTRSDSSRPIICAATSSGDFDTEVQTALVASVASATERTEYPLVAKAGFSLGTGVNKLFKKNGVISLFFSINTTAAIASFTQLFDLPGGVSLPAGSSIQFTAYDTASGAFITQFQVAAGMVRVITSIASGRTIQGSVTWVDPN